MLTSYERLTILEGIRELRVPGLAAASSYFLSLISASVSVLGAFTCLMLISDWHSAECCYRAATEENSVPQDLSRLTFLSLSLASLVLLSPPYSEILAAVPVDNFRCGFIINAVYYYFSLGYSGGLLE